MITGSSRKSSIKKRMAAFYKKAHQNILLTVFLSIMAIMLMAAIIISLQNMAILKRYQQDMSDIAGIAADIDSSLSARTARLSSAELLINNTNRILSTVYFGTADIDEKKEAKDFTAFSIIYKDKFYLITAGHCIEYEDVKYKNFKFRANNGRGWLAPELLTYENDYANDRDYAVFFKSNLLTMGLYPAAENEEMEPTYVLGNIEKDLNLIKEYSDAREGESGSPVLNTKCHVIGILIKKDGSYTPIQEALDAIDKSGK